MTRTLSALMLACAAGLPRIATAEFQPDLATLATVPRVEVPAALVRKALAEPVKSQPYQHAVEAGLTLEPRQGVWSVLDAAGALRSWRLRLASPGARSLSVNFESLALPAGSTLWAYDPQGELVLGPYGPERIGATGLWTAPVAGDELVIEIVAPASSDEGEFKLGKARAFHGFREWKATVAAAEAGDCNVDIACSAANAWRTDAGAVARILIGGKYLCSGQLLNNVRQDKRRLFLTANHCGVEGKSGPADSVVFYFNYVGDQCADGDSDPVPAPTFEGARRLAHDVQSDFALLLITDNAALPSGIYFAGWDATGTGASSGVSIHHPMGDEKKISFFDQSVAHSSVNIGTGCAVDAWEVTWSSGTTEFGSSGGGLWNSAHRLIGVLSGGSASCQNIGGTDYFARLDRAWTASSSEDRQLKRWLDPDNTCVAVVPGLAGNAGSPGSVSATTQNTKCEGQASTCSGRGGGGALDWLSLALLALGVRARRPAARR